VEFDENSLHEFKRNNLNIVADIEANLKLFLTTRWQNAKKFTLPTIFNFDERNEVEEIFICFVNIDFLFVKNIFIIILNQMQDKWNYWFERNPILRSL
jgi:hypothetical protein